MANIAIFLSSDNNYAPFVATTIASICDNTKSFCDFYILDGGITEENKAKICALKSQFDNFSIAFVAVDIRKYFKYDYQNTATHVSISTYNRFLIPDLFKSIQKAIYLDVDIIALGNIDNLYCQNLNDFILGAVPKKINSKNKHNFYDHLDLSHGHEYFNAGVLLIDCEKWRISNITQKLFDVLDRYYNKLQLADQDVLNKTFENSYQMLNGEFNVMSNEIVYGNLSDNIVLRHFNDKIKPWHISPDAPNKVCQNLENFWYYAQKTLFSDILLEHAKLTTTQVLRQGMVSEILKKQIYGVKNA